MTASTATNRPRRPPPMAVTVVETIRLSPTLVRVTFGGRHLEGFRPSAFTDSYVKLTFPKPGVRYPERYVSLFLGALHSDYAALRRYLVDEDFLSRAGGEYWRSGGTVLPTQEPEQAG